MTVLTVALDQLTNPDPRQRDLAVEHIGDLLRGRALSQGDADFAVARLVTHLAVETDQTVRESALNAIANGCAHHRFDLQLLEPIKHTLVAMSPGELAHALYILAATRDQSIRSTIERFLDHPDREVRSYAAEALAELSGKDER